MISIKIVIASDSQCGCHAFALAAEGAIAGEDKLGVRIDGEESRDLAHFAFHGGVVEGRDVDGTGDVRDRVFQLEAHVEDRHATGS